MFKRISNHSDQDLIADIQAGGARRQRAVNQLFRQYTGFIFRGIKQYRLQELEAKDAYADAVVVLTDHVISGRFEGRSKVSTYLFQIFSNKCVDQVRRNTTYKSEQEKDWTHEFPDLPDSSKDFLNRLIKLEEFDQVKGLMEQLGERCKELIWAADYWGYKPDEIAEKMNFKTTKSAITAKYKCMERLRKLIQKQKNPRGRTIDI